MNDNRAPHKLDIRVTVGSTSHGTDMVHS